MSTTELALTQKKTEIATTIENTVAEYYNIDFASKNEETLKKKQIIAMFVSKLVSTKGKTGEAAIMTATPESIRECALAYVNGDFDFFRNQAYIIPYGNTLQFIISKDGLVSGAKKLVPGLEIFSDIVYKGDVFEYEKVGGRTLVTKHTQPIDNITGKVEDIVCAYACAWVDGKQTEAEIMTMGEIVKALATAKRAITDFHKNNPKIMFGKFPSRRLCKRIINQNISPEVSRVISDAEYGEAIVVEPTAEQPTVSINFNEPPAPVEPPYTPKEPPLPPVDIFEATVFGETEETTKQVSYKEWKNGLSESMVGWSMVRGSYDETTKTITIKKVA